MGYIDENLSSLEEIVYLTSLSKIVFIIPFLISFGLLFFGYLADDPLVRSFLIILAIIPLVKSWMKYSSSEFGVTNKRVIVKQGFFNTVSLEIQLNRIESILVYQNFSEKFLNCGTIILFGTGGTKDAFQRIAYPFEFKRIVENQMDSLS